VKRVLDEVIATGSDALNMSLRKAIKTHGAFSIGRRQPFQYLNR